MMHKSNTTRASTTKASTTKANTTKANTTKTNKKTKKTKTDENITMDTDNETEFANRNKRLNELKRKREQKWEKKRRILRNKLMQLEYKALTNIQAKRMTTHLPYTDEIQSYKYRQTIQAIMEEEWKSNRRRRNVRIILNKNNYRLVRTNTIQI
eukprot:135014_1